MPSVSKKQRGMMGADLARAKAGKKTRTGMSVAQLEDFASNPVEKRGRSHRGQYGPQRTTRTGSQRRG